MEEKNKGIVVLPYVSGVSEKLARILKKKIWSAMKPRTKLRALLDHPKIRHPKDGVHIIDCTGCKKNMLGKQ